MSADDTQGDGREWTRRDILSTTPLYAGGWLAVAAAGWGASRLSGPLHVVLVIVGALLALYLLVLGGFFLVMTGFVGLMKWLDRPHPEIPVAWGIVIGYWVMGVVLAGLVALLGLGMRSQEARWFLGSLVAAGLVVTVVYGSAGLQQRRAAARYPSGHGRHTRDPQV